MTELWAMHLEGPDSVIPMASKEEAEAKAWSEMDARWHAVVVPWPHSAEDHAEALAERTDDYF